MTSARHGRYPAFIVETVPPNLLEKYFYRHDDDSYQVQKRLRKRVTFACQNLLQDPPFSRLDLITCRNLLIYLKPEVHPRVMRLFRFALRRQGVLFLGSAESIGETTNFFQPLNRKHRLYRRAGSSRPSMETPPRIHSPWWSSRSSRSVLPLQRDFEGSDLALVLRRALVQKFSPASVLVDETGRTLYFYGATEEFLGHPSGQPTQHLMRLVHPRMEAALQEAFEEAVSQNQEVTRFASLFTRSGVLRRARISVSPVDEADDRSLYLVNFLWELGEVQRTEASEPHAEHAEEMTRLREDHRRSRVELHSTWEQLDLSREELRASNEEVTSVNEELQASNEELETAKEELQSVNEELSTTNAELQRKVEKLEATTNDLTNLLDSTEIATLFLDRDFRIGRYTSALGKLFDVLPSDKGRPIGHLAQKFDDPHLEDDARQVLDQLAPVEREVTDERDRVYVRRIVPYRTETDHIEGVVVTFNDISDRKRAEEELRVLNEELEEQVDLRTNHLQLLQDVAAIANEASTVEEAFRLTLQRICDHDGWLGGQVYEVTDEDLARSTGIRYGCDDEGRFDAWLQGRSPESEDGVLDRVLESGQPLGLSDQAALDHLGGENAQDFGVRSVLLFPVLVEKRIKAVFECVSVDPVEFDPRTLEVIGNVGTHLGRVVERQDMENRLLDLTEQEQRRLGEEIHDTLGQQITGLGMIAKALQAKLEESGSPGVDMAEELIGQIRSTHDQVRTLAESLTPLWETRDLSRALAELAGQCRQLYEVDCRSRVDDVEIRESEAMSLYRIAREAVYNAALHGRPEKIEIRLVATDDGPELQVEDDGRGMDSIPSEDAGGLGLRLMRHRASLIDARLEVESTLGRGTLVRCRLPKEP